MSYSQICAAAGKIFGDPLQTISSGTTPTIIISSVRYDNNSIVSGDNFLLQILQNIYIVSSTITCTVTGVTGNLSLRLMWFDGTDHICMGQQDYYVVSGTDNISMTLSCVIKSNENEGQYIYCQLRNNSNDTIYLTRYRFSMTIQ